jgi:hypothetical protein
MRWVGYIYLVILILFGASALLDDLKARRMGRFALSFIPFAVLVLATIGFLFLPKPGPWAMVMIAAIVVSVPILIFDAVQDTRTLREKDPEFGTGGAIFSMTLVAAMFVPAIVLGVLWALRS